jgi:hypothetical protein
MPTPLNLQEVAYVDAQGCLEALFPDPRSRPSLRWFKQLQHEGVIPFRKIRRRSFFDVSEVRRALDKRYSSPNSVLSEPNQKLTNRNERRSD